jgi:hypothetical protein
MAPEQDQAPDASQDQSQKGSAADSFQKLVSNVVNGMSMLSETVQSAGIAPDIAKGLAQVQQQFQGLIQQMMSGAQGAKPAQGMVPPEAQGAKGAMPASMAR